MSLALVEHKTIVGTSPKANMRDNCYLDILRTRQETIFAMLKHLHPRDDYGGVTGAGLTITKKIIERHSKSL